MQLTIRSYQSRDLPAIIDLFTDTVHYVNSKDYSEQQILAWAPRQNDAQNRWETRIHQHNGFVALIDNLLVGFATLEETGYIDFLYVHHNHLRKGIATYLFTRLEIEAEELGISRLYTHSSKTARPFFEKMGFSILSANQAVTNGVILENWVMEKNL